jgi:hypothetical protein
VIPDLFLWLGGIGAWIVYAAFAVTAAATFWVSCVFAIVCIVIWLTLRARHEHPRR